MIRRLPLVAALAIAATCAGFAYAHTEGLALPDPVASSTTAAGGDEVAVFAGGCFWGIEAVFEHTKGVKSATTGYSGGEAKTAHYDEVSDGDTGHAESVRVVYDPKQVSYGTLLKVFFSVGLDPTEKDRQGPDSGTQYRSVVFTTSAGQQREASAYIAQLDKAKVFDAPIVTQVQPLKAFYPAESYHQDYARLHPDSMYIVINDAPKVANLKKLYPALYRDWTQATASR
ncbi:peptide-methionine (S)-S-oxide reductase MsrA [Pinirhizobacter sp.]|jgi:peptide-methionine (S)-S-oxide reductase|uniref:peptide-methionine (S)-S-oxide reductase MsrA n=1 Tax=Pinirhizobacter sp. TaxID=2950432 RepID=UPI002F421210